MTDTDNKAGPGGNFYLLVSYVNGGKRKQMDNENKRPEEKRIR